MYVRPCVRLLMVILLSVALAACAPAGTNTRQSVSERANSLPPSQAALSFSPTPTLTVEMSDVSLPLSYSGILPEGAVAVLGLGRIATSVSPDGRHFVIWSDREALLYDFETLKPAWDQAKPGGEVTWLLGGEQVAIGRYVWDIRTGDQKLASSLALSAASKWSPRGFIIATPGPGSSILLLEAHTGLEIHRLELLDSLRAALPSDVPGYDQISISFSPNGQLVAATYAWRVSEDYKGDGDTLTIWDVKTGELLRTLTPAKGDAVGRTTMSWSPDSARVATASSDALCVWDVETGEVLKEIGGAQYITWSPDGSRFATSVNAAQEGGEPIAPVRVWNNATLEEEYTLNEIEEAVLWSPDGSRIVTTSYLASTHSIVRDAANGRKLATIPDSERPIAFSADSNRVIGPRYYAYDPSDENTLVVWDIDGDDAGKAAVFQGTSSIVDIAWSPDGKSIAGEMGWWHVPSLAVWDVTEAKARSLLDIEWLGLESHINLVDVDWSPDGSTLAISSEVEGGRLVNIDNLSVENNDNLSGVLAYSPDGAMLASAYGRQIDVQRVLDGEMVQTLTLEEAIVSAIGWSPDGTRIALATIPEDAIWYSGSAPGIAAGTSPTGAVLIWDAQSNAIVATLRGIQGLPYSVAWSPNSREIVAGFNIDTLGIWNAANGTLVRWLYGDIEEYAEEYEEMGYVDVAWSPDGIYIAAAYGKNPFFRECQACYFGTLGKAMLWDAAAGSRVSRYAAHTDEVQAVAFSPNSLLLATGSLDGTVIIWDVNARPSERPDDEDSNGQE
ncbi:MAG: PD40 domain-containing protein [Anaerolineae bacterium]|nr:PD40 domain-containing protein [Anaerolineae bacterium]